MSVFCGRVESITIVHNSAVLLYYLLNTIWNSVQIENQKWGVHLPHDPRVHGVQQEDQPNRELRLRQHFNQVSSCYFHPVVWIRTFSSDPDPQFGHGTGSDSSQCLRYLLCKKLFKQNFFKVLKLKFKWKSPTYRYVGWDMTNLHMKFKKKYEIGEMPY